MAVAAMTEGALIRAFVLNELTLFPFLLSVLGGKTVHLVSVCPIFSPLQGALDRVAASWRARGRCRLAVELVPELEPCWQYDRRLLFRDVFAKYEPWQDSLFRFERADDLKAPYGYGYKQVVTNFVFTRALPAHILAALTDAIPPGRLRVYGASPEMIGMARHLFGPDAAKGVSAFRFPNTLMNLMVAVSVICYSVAWILVRTRLRVVPRKVFFAADFLNDERDLLTIDEISDGGEVLLVFRNRRLQKAQLPQCGQYRQCVATEGRFGLADGLRAVWLVAADTLRLAVAWRRLQPALFYRVATMPHRRAVIRGILNRYRPEYFWGRDDYNVEHILRRHELRRIGAASLGISHAVLTNFCTMFPQWRYISFDYYYTFGIGISQPYLSRWPGDMKLRSTGIFGLSRAQLEQQWPMGEAILFAARVATDEPELVRMAQMVADAFPDREVLIQSKSLSQDEAGARAYFERCRGDRKNMHLATEPIYDLLCRARYVISDVSTLIAEAIQLGIPTFFADVLEMEYCIFREFPGLSCSDAGALVERMREIDGGMAEYPFKDYLEFMGLTEGRNVFDVIREDLGLPPRGLDRAAEAEPASPARNGAPNSEEKIGEIL